MTQYLSDEQRFRIADGLRSAADLAEKKVLVD
jgi:hypothetical protein